MIELMGGIEPARTYLLEAMRAGKQVITANKDLLAEYGDELMEAVTENHCDMLYEASVGGGIPIIHPLKQCLEGNDLTEVMGIVNGTTNYILSKMTGEGMDYAEALAQATGKQIRLSCAVDSALLGGVRLELEGRELDGTVRRRLDALRRSLLRAN